MFSGSRMNDSSHSAIHTIEGGHSLFGIALTDTEKIDTFAGLMHLASVNCIVSLGKIDRDLAQVSLAAGIPVVFPPSNKEVIAMVVARSRRIPSRFSTAYSNLCFEGPNQLYSPDTRIVYSGIDYGRGGMRLHQAPKKDVLLCEVDAVLPQLMTEFKVELDFENGVRGRVQCGTQVVDALYEHQTLKLAKPVWVDTLAFTGYSVVTFIAEEAERTFVVPLTIPKAVWLTGESGSGKTTVGMRFRDKGYIHLDGDAVRAGLNRDLKFSEADRDENIRRVCETARLLVEQGHSVVVTCVTATLKQREMVRTLLPNVNMYRLLRDPSALDTKQLYEKGVNIEYEQPGDCPEGTRNEFWHLVMGETDWIPES